MDICMDGWTHAEMHVIPVFDFFGLPHVSITYI